MVFNSSSSNLSALAPPFTVERPGASRSSAIPLADSYDRPSSNSYFPLNSSVTIRHPDSDPLLPSSLDYSFFTPSPLNLPDSSRRFPPPDAPPSHLSNPIPDHPLLGFCDNEKSGFCDEDGRLDVEKCEVFGDRIDENINLVEDSPCWIPRFLSQTKQTNGLPLRFDMDLDSSPVAPSTSGNELSPIAAAPVPLSYKASSNLLKVQTLVSTLREHSEMLMGRCSELRDEDCDVLKVVIEKLSVCVQTKTGRPVVSPSPNVVERAFGELKKQEEATEAIKKIVAESFRLEGEDSSQARLFKNLWLEAEASQFYLTYTGRFNRMKMELEKRENEVAGGRDLAGSAVNHTTMMADDMARFSDNGGYNLGRYSALKNQAPKEEEAEDMVMARLQVLRRRDRMLV